MKHKINSDGTKTVTLDPDDFGWEIYEDLSRDEYDLVLDQLRGAPPAVIEEAARRLAQLKYLAGCWSNFVTGTSVIKGVSSGGEHGWQWGPLGDLGSMAFSYPDRPIVR